MKIEQFGCQRFGDIEKAPANAPCGKNCIRKAEAYDTVAPCMHLRIRHLYSRDWFDEKAVGIS